MPSTPASNGMTPPRRGGQNKVTPSAPTWHLPLPGLPQRFCEAKDLWEEGEKALSWQSHSVALTAFELGNGALYAPFPDRARALPREKSGRKKRSGCCKAIARICALRRRGRKGDIDCFAATRRQGRAGSPGFYSLSHAAELNNPSVLPLASHRLGGARKTPPRSGNFPTMGNFQARRRSKSPPRRGKALWSAARFVCRMTLYACRSSSHKTRHAIFVGTLKARKHLLAPYTGEAIIRRGRL